jgi:hypothetical protein
MVRKPPVFAREGSDIDLIVISKVGKISISVNAWNC